MLFPRILCSVHAALHRVRREGIRRRATAPSLQPDGRKDTEKMPIKKPPRSRETPERRRTDRKKISSTLELVREGVRRFILNGSTFDDFQKALRRAGRTGQPPPDAMPAAVFRKIVIEAVAERKRILKKRNRM
jgi:hypothetical protein